MSLAPDPATPGLWVDPDWQPGMAGTFAVVIGISNYPHLDGGDTPAPDRGQAWIAEARGLGQLYVSASTARRFFDWLATDYRYGAAPLARCWLLLAPTAAERAHEPAIATDAGAADLAGCTKALDAWYAALRDQPKAAQRESRAFFFFSGHGLQIHHGAQLLLPADYLGGDVIKPQNALSTSNLVYGLASLEIQDRLYFVDACRNDLRELRGKSGRGLEILPEDEAAASYSGARVNAVLYATATALQAWQPKAPAAGPSLYGRAVLDGLRGRPDIELVQRNGLPGVGLCKLQGYARGRVAELLREHQSDNVQPVLLGGEAVQDEVVTELAPQAASADAPLAPSPEPAARTAAARGADLRKLLARPFTVRQNLDTEAMRGWAADAGIGHRAFGSELVTALWQHHTHVLRLSNHQELAKDAVQLRRVEHDKGTRRYRLELELAVPDSVGYWLEVGGGLAAEAVHGVVLPADRSGPLTYRVEADIARDDDPGFFARRLVRLDAGVATAGDGPVGEAAKLWQTYATADLDEAVSAFEASRLREMVRRKHDSPLAATIAALVLLRANRLDLLEDWLRNLANWFPELPDATVLWAEQVLREQPDRAVAVETATRSLLRLAERGLPFTAEGLSYAATLVERLRHARRLIPDDLHDRFAALARKLDTALRYFRPNGLFASYAGFDASFAGLTSTTVARLLPPHQPPTPTHPPASPPPSATTPSGSVTELDDQVVVNGVVVPKRGTD